MKRRPSTMLIPDTTGPILISPIAISQRVNNGNKHNKASNNLTKEQENYMRQKWVSNLRKRTQQYSNNNNNNNNLLQSISNEELKYLPFATAQGKNMPSMHLGVNIAPYQTMNPPSKMPTMQDCFDSEMLASDLKERRQYETIMANGNPTKRTITQRSKWMKRLLKKRGGPTITSLAKMKSPRRKLAHEATLEEMEYFTGNNPHPHLSNENNEIIEPYPFLSPRHVDSTSYGDASLFSGLGTPSNFLHGCADTTLTYGFNNAIWDIPREHTTNSNTNNIPPIGCANFELDMTCLDTLLVEASPRWLNNSHPLTPLNVTGVSARRLSVSGTIRLTGTPKPIQKMLLQNNTTTNSNATTTATMNNNEDLTNLNKALVTERQEQSRGDNQKDEEDTHTTNRSTTTRSLRLQNLEQDGLHVNQYVQQANIKIMHHGKTEYIKSPSLLRRHSLAAGTHKEALRTVTDVVMPDLSSFLDDYKVTDIDKELDNFYMEKMESML